MASPTIDNTKILYYGLQSAYDALQNKDSDILYFCTDSKKIFKGTVEMTEQVIFAAAKSGVASPVSGKLYIFADTGTVEVYNGSAWTVVSYPILKSIAGGDAGITSSSTDVQVPSAKAVYEYVQSIVAGDSVVTAVAASETEGYISVTVGDDEPVDVPVHGVVTTPTYDASTRKFTFPISDGSSVEVELGTDIFIDPTANNRYEDGYLYLYLNDGNASAEPPKDPTELKIPVIALITDYFGDNTDTVSVNVDNSTHKVTADVRIRPDSAVTGSEFTNLIKVSSATGAEGLYFDRTQLDLNTAALEVLNATAGVTGSVAQQVKVVQDAVDILNSDASTTGSVAYAVKELADGAVAANTAALEVLNATAGVTGSVAQQVKALEDGAVATNAANIQVLATAQGWGTF